MGAIDFSVGGTVRPSIDTVNLSYMGLTELPRELFKFRGVKTLYLEGNQLTRVPRSIRKLKDLEWVFLQHNPLKSCREVERLKHLRRITLPINMEVYPELDKRVRVQMT